MIMKPEKVRWVKTQGVASIFSRKKKRLNFEASHGIVDWGEVLSRHPRICDLIQRSKIV